MKLFLSSLLLLAGIALLSDAAASLLLAREVQPVPVDPRCATLQPADYKKADPNLKVCGASNVPSAILCTQHQNHGTCTNGATTGYEVKPMIPQGCVTSSTKSLCDEANADCWRACTCVWIEDDEFFVDYCTCSGNDTWIPKPTPKTVNCP